MISTRVPALPLKPALTIRLARVLKSAMTQAEYVKQKAPVSLMTIVEPVEYVPQAGAWMRATMLRIHATRALVAMQRVAVVSPCQAVWVI